tara:strand:+ start:858 stop:1619 length:762 start_codon:yes stop_codon:yes gene_type:complete
MTSISEEEFEKPIIISKFNFSCDDEDLTIPEPLPRKSFSMLIIGKPGSGKTNLLLNLITKRGRCFNRKFDKVFIVSPSLATIKDEDPFELLPEEQKYDKPTTENLEKILSIIKDSGEKVLIILDDVIAETRGAGHAQVENLLQKMFFNRRHLCGANGSASIIATSQTYNKICPKLRKSASHLICFENRNKKEQENLFKEVILIPEKEYNDVLKYTFDKKHNFMYIDTTKKEDEMLHKNFNKLIIDSPNIIKFT